MPKALIIGAGDGLSASLARLLAREGYAVALAARNIAKLDALVAQTGAVAHACDAASEADIAALFDAEGDAEVVVYNPSFRTRGPISDLVPADVQRALQVCAFGAFLAAQQAARRMVAARVGHHPADRRFRRREGLRAIRALRHGQVRAARPGAVAGARTAPAGRACRAHRHRWRHPFRAPRRRPATTRCSTPTRSRETYCS